MCISFGVYGDETGDDTGDEDGHGRLTHRDIEMLVFVVRRRGLLRIGWCACCIVLVGLGLLGLLEGRTLGLWVDVIFVYWMCW